MYIAGGAEFFGRGSEIFLEIKRGDIQKKFWSLQGRYHFFLSITQSCQMQVSIWLLSDMNYYCLITDVCKDIGYMQCLIKSRINHMITNTDTHNTDDHYVMDD